jgi:uncharacterized membrane protein YkoI
MLRHVARASLLPVLALALSLATGASAHADDEGEEKDHDAARRAVEAGEVQPLAVIRDRVASRLGGRVVGVEFERQDGRYVYEFKVIARDGRLLEVEVDARTGAIIRNGAD